MSQHRTTPAPPGTNSRRDPFFDAVRAVAIVRVVAWHTLQWPLLSYIAAMPVMFFVGGALAQASFEGRSPLEVVRRRLGRLLPPLWAYGAIAWLMFALTGAAVGLHSIVWWIVPLWDPTGPDAAVAWWAPLWYLRAYLWLLLVTPLLLGAMRRIGVAATLVLLAAAATSGALAVDGGRALPSQVRDLALYGMFWGFGLAAPRVRAKLGWIRPVWRAALAAGCAAAAGAWLIARPAPLGIVNASPMAELLLGIAWIIGLTALAAPISRIAAWRFVHRVVGVLNRRAMSTYLWHCGAIALSHAALEALGVEAGLRTALLVALVAVITVALVTAAGPIEDITATRRHIRSVRSRVTVGVCAVPCLFVAATLLPVAELQGAQGAYIPASGRGLDRLIENRASTVDLDADWTQPTGPVTTDELDDLLAAWQERWDISGVAAAIGRSDGVVWSGAAGVDAQSGEAMSGQQIIPAHSITKTFTGALIVQLDAEHHIDLDERLVSWVPEFPHASAMTLRQLAQHTSGLVDTGEDPSTALGIAGDEPLLFAPGSGTRYADTSYYLLGLVAERATGQSYDDLVAERYFRPFGLDTTELAAVDRWSAGGVHTTVADLATWAPIFWGGGLGDEVAAEATRLDPTNNFGIGTFGYCPCRGLGDLYRAELYGHLSAQGRLAWDPIDDLAVMVHTNEENDGGRTIDAWTELDRLLRRQVRGRALSSASGGA
jgi:CubicO group peptidase (beta-lactamase class C family)/peptidoglycan/LPS O-acetylase OafA/YrhL